MRKGTTAIQNLQLLKWCKEVGIVAYWNLIYGFPGESPADYTAMVSILDTLHHLQPPHGIGPIRLDRFSPNFVNSREFGITNIRPDRNYRYIYDLPEIDLLDMAYFFEHDYADGRDPEAYVGDVRAAVRRWHAESGNRGLLYADHGDNLAIWDLRPDSRCALTILTGHERVVFLHCDRHRSLAQIEAKLQEIGATDVTIQPFLNGLIERRMMIHLDGRYLALAVSASPTPYSQDTGPRHLPLDRNFVQANVADS